MAYGKKYTPRKSPRSTPRIPRGKYTPRKNYRKKMPMVSFAQKVNQIVARNVENKMTQSYTETSTICTRNTAATNVYDWFLVKDWNVKLFTISQGATVQQRIGNQIKLKRWVIKGLISPVVGGPVSTTLGNTSQGYVNVYFGRLISNGEVSTTLPSFYDNGSTSAAPTGAMSQIFKTVNKDEYKVYYRKTFKLSPHTSVGGQITTINNDFSLVRTFGFDVTRFICKNAIIKYNDSDNDPNNGMIRQLAIWATWQPAVGDMSIGSFGYTHYYNITLQSFAEYEDA